MNYKLVPLIVVLFLASLLNGQSLPYTNTALHFSFSIPNDWEQIPDDILQSVASQLAKQGGTIPHYEAGFQRKGDEWFRVPYVLVQYLPGSSSTLDDVTRTIEESTDEVATNTKLKQLVPDARFGKPQADHERGLVLIPLSTGGSVQGLSALKPGRNGLVQLSYYDRSSDLSKTFDVFLNSLKFAPGYEYSPTAPTVRKFGSLGSRVVQGAIKGIIYAGVIGVIGYLFRRRKNKAAPTTPKE